MRRLAQSTAYTVVFAAFLSSDHVSAATGKTIAITISKAGAAFGNLNAGATNATEISSGFYKVALDTTDTGTLGDLAILGTATGVDNFQIINQVVSATTGGASNLDVASSTLATPTNITAGTITTVTNLTNAPTNGDLTATMKASVTTAATAATPTAAAVTGAVGSVTGNVGGSVAGSVASVTAGVTLTSGERNSTADALLDRSAGVETGLTPRQWFRLAAAALLGKATGLDTGAPIYRDTNDTTNRITATTDANGNRSAVTLNAA